MLVDEVDLSFLIRNFLKVVFERGQYTIHSIFQNNRGGKKSEQVVVLLYSTHYVSIGVI